MHEVGWMAHRVAWHAGLWNRDSQWAIWMADGEQYENASTMTIVCIDCAFQRNRWRGHAHLGRGECGGVVGVSFSEWVHYSQLAGDWIGCNSCNFGVIVYGGLAWVGRGRMVPQKRPGMRVALQMEREWLVVCGNALDWACAHRQRSGWRKATRNTHTWHIQLLTQNITRWARRCAARMRGHLGHQSHRALREGRHRES